MFAPLHMPCATGQQQCGLHCRWHACDAPTAQMPVQALKWTQPIWEGLPEAERDELAALGLWERDAMVAFGREVKQG